MKQYKYSTLANIVKKFRQKKIMVIGDLLLDQYIWGEVSRISPEAPVPVVWVKKESYVPGGACNVANNLSSLGAKVSLVGVVGSGGDEKTRKLIEELHNRNISTDGVISDGKRPTSLKTRVIAHNPSPQQVVRIDREDIHQIPLRHQKTILKYVKKSIKEFDALVIEDYGKGVITPQLISEVVRLAKRNKKFVAVDPKESHFGYYKDVSVITPNRHEAEKDVGFAIDSKEALFKAGDKLVRKHKADVILITLGEGGMMVFEKGKRPHKISTLVQEVFDVSGAGDTVIAVYALSAVSGGSPIQAARIANCAAGMVVEREGTAVVEQKELLSRLKQVTGK